MSLRLIKLFLYFFVLIGYSAEKAAAELLGDMNGNGVLEQSDLDFFAIAYFDPITYQLLTGLDLVEVGDANQDGIFSGKDVFPFGHLHSMTDTEIYAYLESISGFPTGDANFDGCVNLSDFGILKQNFGLIGDELSADFDLNGKVDLTDFGVLKTNFGRCI